MTIPTRTQIQNKINEIVENPIFSTLKSEIYQKVSDWLDEIECPANDKEKILDDLGSYEHY